MARSLARFDDPEGSAVGSLPAAVRLADVCGAAASDLGALVRAWSGLGVDPPPRAPVGLAADGVVEFDLDRDGFDGPDSPPGRNSGLTTAQARRTQSCAELRRVNSNQ